MSDKERFVIASGAGGLGPPEPIAGGVGDPLRVPMTIAWKEPLQLRRDRLTLGMMAGLPLLQLLLFGYAINTDVHHLRTVVFDQDGTASSRGRTCYFPGRFRSE